MAKVLFTWELGAGWGHLMTIRPLAEALAAAGHDVTVAAKGLGEAQQLLSPVGARVVGAPTHIGKKWKPIANPATFAHMLYNASFGDVDDLIARARAWRALFELAQADVLVADHSPTALLAARASNIPRVAVNNGFCIPPPMSPLPDWRPWLRRKPQALARDEQQVLERANYCLGALGAAGMRRITDIYGDLEGEILTTFPELDHFDPSLRQDPTYYGTWRASVGKAPTWPQLGRRLRVLAYLGQFVGLPVVLDRLRRLPVSALVIGPRGLGRGVVGSATNVHFAPRPVDIVAAIEQCDLFITNGSFTTSSVALLAGKPQLILPLQLEQRLTATRIGELGAAFAPNDPNDRAMLDAAFEAFWDRRDRMAAAASAMSARYSDWDYDGRLRAAVDVIVRVGRGPRQPGQQA